MPKKANLEDLEELRKRPGEMRQMQSSMYCSKSGKAPPYIYDCTHSSFEFLFIDFLRNAHTGPLPRNLTREAGHLQFTCTTFTIFHFDFEFFPAWPAKKHRKKKGKKHSIIFVLASTF